VSIGYDSCDLAGVADVVQRVGSEKNEIGNPACLDGAEVVELVVEPCRIEGGGLEGFEWGEACRYKALQFKMETDARNDIDSRGCIGAG